MWLRRAGYAHLAPTFCCRTSVQRRTFRSLPTRAFPVAFSYRLWYHLFYAAHNEAPETTWKEHKS